MLGLLLLAEAAKEETRKVDPKPVPHLVTSEIAAEVLKHKAKRYRRWAEEIEDLLS